MAKKKVQPNPLAQLSKLPISSWAWPRILVGIPLERSISYAERVFFPFLHIASQGPAFVEIPYGRTDLVRNLMVLELLRSDYTHLLMLDVDHEHPYDIVQRLARWTMLNPELLVLTGLNYRRCPPYEPVTGLVGEDGKRHALLEWPKGLVEVDDAGAASLLVHRSVFEQLEPPWFFNLYDPDLVWANSWPGEDTGFFRKLRQAGIKAYCDTTLTSPHCTESLVGDAQFRAWREAHPDSVLEAKRAAIV